MMAFLFGQQSVKYFGKVKGIVAGHFLLNQDAANEAFSYKTGLQSKIIFPPLPVFSSKETTFRQLLKY
jgi:hypothetical protein